MPQKVFADENKTSVENPKKINNKQNEEANSVFSLGTMTIFDDNKSAVLASRDILTSVDVMYADKLKINTLGRNAKK